MGYIIPLDKIVQLLPKSPEMQLRRERTTKKYVTAVEWKRQTKALSSSS